MSAIEPGIRGREPLAKAALVQFLRESGCIDRTTAIAAELAVAKQARRADLAVIGERVHFFEVKSRSDTLARLDGQLAAYETTGEMVTVAAASRHINAILSRVGEHVGVLEIVEFGGQTGVRSVRDASLSPNWNLASALQLLPASEIRTRLLDGVPLRRRADLMARAAELPKGRVRAQVVQFLKSRYLPTTKLFLRRVQRREVRADDLATLRVWLQRSTPVRPQVRAEQLSPSPETDCQRYLFHVGKSFGPVPEDVQQLLAG